MIAPILDNDTVHFEHREAGFVIRKRGEGDWAVEADDGRAVGTLTVVSPDGEDGEPVFGGTPAGQVEIVYEGSDWESIVRALANGAIDESSGTALAL